jgi:hypothetical protein
MFCAQNPNARPDLTAKSKEQKRRQVTSDVCFPRRRRQYPKKMGS